MTKRRTQAPLSQSPPLPPPPGDADGVSLSEAIAALHAHSVEARVTRNGRELTVFEAHPDKVGRMIDLLVAGNYRETAATIAGITPRVLRLWMQQASEGDPRYLPFATVVQVAEAMAESSAVQSVRKAGKDPRFWAAEMTYLERRHPEKWGRRQDTNDSPKVIVQIGVSAADVHVNVSATSSEHSNADIPS